MKRLTTRLPHLIALIFLVAACSTNRLNEDPEAVASAAEPFVSQVVDVLELKPWMNLDPEAAEAGSRAMFIMLALAATTEVATHNLNGASGNEVWTHEDGHREAVYDIEENLVEDCANQGSYNYFSPWDESLNHFTYDTLPWIYLGNCEDDPTSREDRIEAFFKDFRLGVFTIVSQGYPAEGIQPRYLDEEGERVALALFLKIMDENPDLAPEKLPSDYEIEENKAALRKFIMSFEKGFLELTSRLLDEELIEF